MMEIHLEIKLHDNFKSKSYCKGLICFQHQREFNNPHNSGYKKTKKYRIETSVYKELCLKA